MKPIVKLSDVAEQIDMTNDGAQSFYNELTGEFYYYCEGFTDDERDLDEEEGWLRLPSQRDADEYEMMSDFADTLNNHNYLKWRTQCEGNRYGWHQLISRFE